MICEIWYKMCAVAWDWNQTPWAPSPVTSDKWCRLSVTPAPQGQMEIAAHCCFRAAVDTGCEMCAKGLLLGLAHEPTQRVLAVIMAIVIIVLRMVVILILCSIQFRWISEHDFFSNLSVFKLLGMCWNFSFVDKSLSVLFAVVSYFSFSFVLFFPLHPPLPHLCLSGNHFAFILLMSQQEEERRR